MSELVRLLIVKREPAVIRYCQQEMERWFPNVRPTLMQEFREEHGYEYLGGFDIAALEYPRLTYDHIEGISEAMHSRAIAKKERLPIVLVTCFEHRYEKDAATIMVWEIKTAKSKRGILEIYEKRHQPPPKSSDRLRRRQG